MERALQVVFKDLPVSEAVEAACCREAEKLERYDERVIGCRVVVAMSHRHQHAGNLFEIRINVAVPRGEVVVNRVPRAHHKDEDVFVAIREAFDTARRQLQDLARRRRHQVKMHEVPAHGRVVMLEPDEGYGFLRTHDGREIYFHQNSVLGQGFAALELGTEVRFVEEQGEQGPSATSVTAVGRHGHLPPAHELPPHV